MNKRLIFPTLIILGVCATTLTYTQTIEAQTTIVQAIPSTSTMSFTRTLKYGNQGSDVTLLQYFLTEEGYYVGPITTFFGTKTKNSLKSYQISRGIPQTGKLDIKTITEIKKQIDELSI